MAQRPLLQRLCGRHWCIQSHSRWCRSKMCTNQSSLRAQHAMRKGKQCTDISSGASLPTTQSSLQFPRNTRKTCVSKVQQHTFRSLAMAAKTVCPSIWTPLRPDPLGCRPPLLPLDSLGARSAAAVLSNSSVCCAGSCHARRQVAQHRAF